MVFDEPIDPATFTPADLDTSGSTATGITLDSVAEVAPNDGKTFTATVGATGDGDLVVTVPAGLVTDLGGNTNNAAVATDNVVTVDTTPPTTVATIDAIANDTGTNDDDYITNDNNGLTISATLSAPLETGEALEYSADNGSTWVDATGSVSTGTNVVHSDPTFTASNTAMFRVTDLATNSGAENGQAIIVDTDAPTSTPLPTSPVAGSFVSDPTDLIGSCGIESANGVVTLTTPGDDLSPDPLVVVLDANGDYSTTMAWAASANGTNQTLGVVCSDLAGNEAPAVSITPLRVDFSGPEVTIEKLVGQQSPTNDSPVTYTATFNEPVDTASFVPADIDVSTSTATGVTVDAVTEIAPNDGTTFAVEVSATGDGDITVTLPAGVVDDLSGNTNNLATATDNTITYDGTAPAAPAAPDLNAASDTGDDDTDNLTSATTPLIDVVCSEADSTLTLYTDAPVADTLAGTHTCSSVGPAQITVSPALSDGEQKITYTETDIAGNVSPVSDTGAVIVDSTSPILVVNSPSGIDIQPFPVVPVEVVCTEIGELVTITGADLTPNPTTHTCATAGCRNNRHNTS